MEIDHFDPSLIGFERNRYENLFLSTRHCNNSKSNTWPEKALRKKGVRIINPCKEQDYGLHFFEHPITHRLLGVTPAGVYHIAACDLNAPHLVMERKERAEGWRLLEEVPVTVKKGPGIEFPLEMAQNFRVQVEKMIPRIPYLPKSHPLYADELLLVEALHAMCLKSAVPNTPPSS